MVDLQKFEDSFVERKNFFTWQAFEKRFGKRPDVRPSQLPDEFSCFLDLYTELKPMVTLEIGICKGFNLSYFSRLKTTEAKIVGIDIDPNALVIAKTIPENKDVDMVCGDSNSEEVYNYIKTTYPSIDFLFIDGNHMSPFVDRDYELYSPLVKKGIIAFHDIVQVQGEGDYDVWKLWKRIKTGRYLEFKNGGYAPAAGGIGVMFVGM